MKKLFLAGVLFGVLNFVQATTITLVGASSSAMLNTSQIVGTDAYQFLLPQIVLTAGQTLSDVSVNFSGIELISSDSKDQVSADLMNLNGYYNSSQRATQAFVDNDDSGDYFSTKYPHGTVISLGTEATQLDKSLTWSDPIAGAAEYSILTGGSFDIGIDPDCYYDIGSITFCYTINNNPSVSTPDQAATVVLLGLSFLGLLAFRRKLCLN
jgi:hypothetical protein